LRNTRLTSKEDVVTFFKIAAESRDTLASSRSQGTILATKGRHDHELPTQIGRPAAPALCYFPEGSPWIRSLQNVKKEEHRVAAIETTPNNSPQILIATGGK